MPFHTNPENDACRMGPLTVVMTTMMYGAERVGATAETATGNKNGE